MAVTSRHFFPHDYQCHCGCGLQPGQPILDILDQIWDVWGPIQLDSVARCEAHNLAEGGAKNSRHIAGDAADIKLTSPEFALWISLNLYRFNVYMEHPDYTKSWRHLQLTAPKSGNRVFVP